MEGKLKRIRDVAPQTPYSEEYLSLLVRRGKIPGRKIGKTWYVQESDVAAYILRQKERVESQEFIPVVEAAEVSPYDADYLRILARAGRLRSKKIKRNWYIQVGDLHDYIFQQQRKFKNRKVLLASYLEGGKETGTPVTLYDAVTRGALPSSPEGISRQPHIAEPTWRLQKRFLSPFTITLSTLLFLAGVGASGIAVYSLMRSSVLQNFARELGFLPGEGKEEGKITTREKILEHFKVREVIERKEVFVPADLAVVKSAILADMEELNRAIRATVEVTIAEFRAQLARTSTRTDSSIQMVTLTQKIDQLDSIDITNGMKVQSGGIEVVDGDVTANRFVARKGLSSSAGTSTLVNLSLSGNAEVSGVLTVSGTATSTIAGQLAITKVPTLMHTFGSWAINVADSNVADASLLINPASAAADTNLFGIAVAGGVKFLVDAEGDVFVNSLTSVGGTVLATTTASTFTVENNFTAGDAIGDVLTIHAGTINYVNRSTSTVPNNQVNAWALATSSTSTPIFSIDTTSGGRVGIGTTSPYALLSLMNTTSGRKSFVISTSTTPFKDAASLLHVSFEIDENGKAGIGVEATDQSLEVDAVENAVSIGGILGTNQSTGIMFRDIFTQHAGIRWTDDGSRNIVIEDASNAGNPSTWYSGTAVNLLVRNGRFSVGSTTAGAMLTASSTSAITAMFDQRGTNDILRLLDSGSPVFVVQDGGSVGIGTTSPSTLLQIRGTDPIFSIDAVSSVPNLDFYRNTVFNARIAVSNSTGGVSAGSTAGDLVLRAQNNDILFTTDAGATGNMIITTAGNVGIGTAGPNIVGDDRALTIYSSTGLPALELATNRADANNVSIGEIPFVYDTNSAGHKTVADINVSSDGTTANQRGGVLRFFTKPDASVGLVERMRINQGGNVGIGTTSPADISGGSATSLLQINGGAGTGVIEVTSNATANTSRIASLYFGTSGATASDKRSAMISSVLTGDSGTNVTGEMQFYTVNAGVLAQAMVIDKAGNVGIGTTSPSFLFTVLAGSNTNIAKFGGTSSGLKIQSNTGSIDLIGETPATVAQDIEIRPANVTTALRITSTGNVGIGTTSPQRLLHVNAGTGTSINNPLGAILTNSQNAANETIGLQFGFNGIVSNSAAITAIQVDTTNQGAHLAFVTRDGSGGGTTAERMRITNSGNVGIGTTSPSGVFAVSLTGTSNEMVLGLASSQYAKLKNNGSGGSLRIEGSGGMALQINASGAGVFVQDSTGSGNARIANDSTTNSYFAANGGNVGIGTTSPMEKLAVSGGNIAASGCLKDAETGVNNAGTCVDIAEAYVAGEELLPGDIVAVQSDPSAPEGFSIVKARKSSEVEPPTGGSTSPHPAILGIISTRPAVYMQGDLAYFGGSRFSASSIFPAGSEAPLALAGRVPVRISLEGGPIKVGDRITSSSLAGMGMKATTSGVTVGIALEPFDGWVRLPDGTQIATSTGKILVFVNLGYAKLDDTLFEVGLQTGGSPTSSANNAEWSVDQTTGKVSTNFTGGLDLKGNDIINVSRIVSANGTWSISEDGTLMATRVITEEVIAQHVKTLALTVGSAESPSGVTLFDLVTRAPLCVYSENGLVQSKNGECAVVVPASSATQVIQTASSTVIIEPNLTTIIATSTVEISASTTLEYTYIQQTETAAEPIAVSPEPVAEPAATSTLVQ